jgi:uncharacterized protein YjdB
MKRCVNVLLLLSFLLGSEIAFSQAFTTADYRKAEWMTARFYGAQRASLKTGTTSNWLLQNQGTATDFNNDNDGGYDLTGGWFDCGDHPMFGQTQFYSAYVLLKGYDLWPAGYGDYYSQTYAGYFKAQNYNWEGTGHDPDGIPDIVNEVKYATDFFIKATRSATQFYSQKGQGNADHKHWITSVKMATLATAEGGQPRVMYSNVKDASMASFCAATLALMSRVYRQYDATYADLCLAHAKFAYAFAKANQATAGSPEGAFYGANAKWQDDYASMCTELYYATNDATYKTEALSYEGNVTNHNYCFGYNNDDDIAAYNLATLGSTKSAALLASFASTYKAAVNGSGIYTGGDATWGTLRYNANAAFVVAMNMVYTKTTGVDPFIYKQVDYILGNNTAGSGSSKLSFVVGFGSNSVKYPHHRNVYLNDNDVANTAVISIPARNAQFGYLVGGIRSGTYTDSRDNYTNGEGGIDYSAGLVGAIAYILAQTATVNPTGVTVAPKPLAVPLSGTMTVSATVAPAGATPTVTWTSSNTSIATVDATGIVTGVALGTAYIIAKTATGNFKDSTLCTVSKINVTGVTVTPTTLSLTVGNTGQLTALTVPTNASNQNMIWSSSDATIASVSSTGLVTGLAVGSVMITVTTAEGSFKATAPVTVAVNLSTVMANQVATPPTIDGNITEADWNLSKSITKVASGTMNNTATFGLLWDANNLYVAVKVLDATITTSNTNVYDNDGVELYFDMNNNNGGYDASDRQWVKVMNSTNIWEKIGTGTGANTTTSKVVSATKAITGGYTMEFAIPWTNSFGITPSTATIYGFDIAINDCDGGTTRSNQVMWIGDANDYTTLTNVGDLRLAAGSTTITQTIALAAGWNLVSFNVVPTDSTIATVFNGVMTNVKEIKTADAFYSTTNTSTALNSLKSIEQGKGYLVNMKATGTLSLTGVPSTFTATKVLGTMKTGWNLVGCVYQTSTAIATAFDITKISAVKNFSGFYVSGGTANSLTNVVPSNGYFVKKN